MENVGGELNAYTTKEETFVYSIFMEEDFGRAFELLTDLVFHSQFPKQEIEKEVDVILDEINSYEDSPSELIFDEFENLLYKGHTSGSNILGDGGNPLLSLLTPSPVRSFHASFLRPGEYGVLLDGTKRLQEDLEISGIRFKRYLFPDG